MHYFYEFAGKTFSSNLKLDFLTRRLHGVGAPQLTFIKKEKIKKAKFLISTRNMKIIVPQLWSTENIDGFARYHALPYFFAAQGLWVVHASAVLVRNKAVLFSGQSGAGKSTLAHNLARTGLAFLSDECVALSFDENQKVRAFAYSQSPRLHATQLKRRVPFYNKKGLILQLSSKPKREGYELGQLFFISRTKKGKTRQAEISADEALVLSLKNSYWSKHNGSQINSQLLATISNMTVRGQVKKLYIEHKNGVVQKLKRQLYKIRSGQLK